MCRRGLFRSRANPDSDKLHAALDELFARYGKVPKPLARIFDHTQRSPAEAGPTDE